MTVTATGSKMCSSPEVTSNQSWIGMGPISWKNTRGTVKVSAGATTISHDLSGSVTIGDKSVPVIQKGIPCTISLLYPSSEPVPVSGGNYSFSVSVAPSDCPWIAASNKTWINLSSASGTGNGTVTYTVPANTTRKNQTGTVTVTLENGKKKSHKVTQKGK